jgi:alkylation response protein AidB-like acyl-CoA dehydrogenase
MNLGPSDDGRFRSELVAFLEENAPPEATNPARRATGDLVPEWARRWQATLFDHGWMIPSNPRHLGGRDASAEQSVLFLEEMSRRNIPRSLHFPGYGIAAPSLLEFGTPSQRLLAPAAIRGDTVWCIGMSEPDAGSDLASLRTRAEVYDDRFVVSGQKVWTSFAPIADKCLCYVRTDPGEPRHRGISALILDMDFPGISVRPLRNIMGSAEFAEVYFDNVVVPRDRLLGELHSGWRVTQGSLGHERSSMWMEAVARLDRAVGDLLSRCRRLGRDSDPLIRRRIVIAYERVTCLRALGFRSMTGVGPGQLFMKLATSELYTEVLALAIDLQGPAGLIQAAASDRDWWRDFLGSLAGTIAGGTSDIQRNVIARHALDLPGD